MFNNVRRLSGQLFVYGSADVAVLGINFILLPLYTRVLSPAEYGALALLLVVEALLKPLYRWGLDTSFLRLYYDYSSPNDRQTLAGTIVIFMLLVNGLVTLALVACFPFVTEKLFGSQAYDLALLLLVGNRFVSGFLFLPFSLLRIQERSRWFAMLTFIRSFGTVVARLVLVIGLRWSITGIMLADLIVSIILILSLQKTFRQMTKWRFSWNMAREALRFGFPRVPQGLLHQGAAMGDRVFLSLYLPLEQVGVYLIGTSIASVIKLYPEAFNTAWMPFAFERMKGKNASKLFARLGTYAFGVLVFVTLVIAGLSEFLVKFMTPETFHGGAKIVPLLVLGMAIQSTSMFISTSLNVSKQTYVYPLATFASVLVSVGGYLLLIPQWGLLGAATGAVLGQLTLVVVLSHFAQRYYAIPYEWARLIKATLVGAILYGIMTLLSAPSVIVSILMTIALIAIFPAGLFALKFFKPTELGEIREFIVQTLPGIVKPVKSGLSKNERNESTTDRID